MTEQRHYSKNFRQQNPSSLIESRTLIKWVLSIAIIFSSALLLKVMFNYHQHLQLVDAVKHGVILDPPAPIAPLLEVEKANYPALSQLLAGKWGLVYVSAGLCKETCINNIAKILSLRQQTIGSEHVPYLMLVSLASSQSSYDPIKTMLGQQYPAIWNLSTNTTFLQQFLEHVPAGTQTLTTDRLYLINNQLQAIASYNPATPHSDLQSDFNAIDTDG